MVRHIAALNTRLVSTIAVGFAIGLSLAAVRPAAALPVLVGTTSDATGLTGLSVDGQTYDVTFVFDTYANVFADSAPIFGGNSAVAADAINALTVAMNTLDVTMVTGGNSGNVQSLVIPDSPVDGSGNYYGQQTLFGYVGSYWSGYPTPADSNSVINEYNTYGHNVMAVFAAPEPGSLALLGTGLAGLRWLRRRRRAA